MNHLYWYSLSTSRVILSFKNYDEKGNKVTRVSSCSWIYKCMVLSVKIISSKLGEGFIFVKRCGHAYDRILPYNVNMVLFMNWDSKKYFCVSFMTQISNRKFWWFHWWGIKKIDGTFRSSSVCSTYITQNIFVIAKYVLRLFQT